MKKNNSVNHSIEGKCVIIPKQPFNLKDCFVIIFFALINVLYCNFFQLNIIVLLLLLFLSLWCIYDYTFKRITDKGYIKISKEGFGINNKNDYINNTFFYWNNRNHISKIVIDAYFQRWKLLIYENTSESPHIFFLDEFNTNPISLKRDIEKYFSNVMISKGDFDFVWNWKKYELANKGIYKD